MKMLKAILVDFDGTLVDSEEANANAYYAALSDSGIECSLDNLKKNIVGNHWSNFLPKVIGENYTKALGESIAARKKKIYQNYYSDITLNIALVEILVNLPNHILLAIVSNASRETISEILKSKGISQLFKLIIGSEDFENGKPDSEPYVLAMNRLNVSTDECLVIEDSEIGLQSARAAGIKVLQVKII